MVLLQPDDDNFLLSTHHMPSLSFPQTIQHSYPTVISTTPSNNFENTDINRPPIFINTNTIRSAEDDDNLITSNLSSSPNNTGDYIDSAQKILTFLTSTSPPLIPIIGAGLIVIMIIVVSLSLLPHFHRAAERTKYYMRTAGELAHSPIENSVVLRSATFEYFYNQNSMRNDVPLETQRVSPLSSMIGNPLDDLPLMMPPISLDPYVHNPARSTLISGSSFRSTPILPIDPTDSSNFTTSAILGASTSLLEYQTKFLLATRPEVNMLSFDQQLYDGSSRTEESDSMDRLELPKLDYENFSTGANLDSASSSSIVGNTNGKRYLQLPTSLPIQQPSQHSIPPHRSPTAPHHTVVATPMGVMQRDGRNPFTHRPSIAAGGRRVSGQKSPRSKKNRPTDTGDPGRSIALNIFKRH